MSIQVEEIPDEPHEKAKALVHRMMTEAPTTDEDGEACYSGAIMVAIVEQALLAERDRATRVQIEKDAALVETMPLEAWATPSHFAQRDKMRADVASAIRHQLTGG